MQRLKTENMKMGSDIKIIRNDHTELLHQIFNLERKVSGQSIDDIRATFDEEPVEESKGDGSI